MKDMWEMLYFHDVKNAWLKILTKTKSRSDLRLITLRGAASLSKHCCWTISYRTSWEWDALYLCFPLPSLSGLSSSRMASPLWPSPYNRATTRWSLSYWRTIQRARSACPPCTLLPARTTRSQLLSFSRTTTTLMSSQRYAHNTVWREGWHVWKSI